MYGGAWWRVGVELEAGAGVGIHVPSSISLPSGKSVKQRAPPIPLSSETSPPHLCLMNPHVCEFSLHDRPGVEMQPPGVQP